MTDALVSTDWLAPRLGEATIRIIDATWFLPAEGRSAEAEFRAAHIPGAVRFDIDTICDRSSTLPHMIPTPEQFAAQVGALGVSNAHHVVVYNADGSMAAPRAWWMFRLFGHDRVSVLDGGLAKWRAEGRPVASGDATAATAAFVARLRPELVRKVGQVRDIVAGGDALIVDARDAKRFTAESPETRPGLRGGHMPGARNLPSSQVQTDARTFLDADALRPILAKAGVDLARPIVTTCGSGVSACTLALAFHRLGKTDVAVYDGSWTEWGGLPDTPVATGPA